jgi:hypothetical protein
VRWNLFGLRFKNCDLMLNFFKSRVCSAKPLTGRIVSWEVFRGVTYVTYPAKSLTCFDFLLNCFLFVAFKLLQFRIRTTHITSVFIEENIT